MGAQGWLTNKKNFGYILFFLPMSFEKMPILWFEHVKTADFGSEKKISIPYACDGRPLFSYNRSRFITAFMEVKKIYFTIVTSL